MRLQSIPFLILALGQLLFLPQAFAKTHFRVFAVLEHGQRLAIEGDQSLGLGWNKNPPQYLHQASDYAWEVDVDGPPWAEFKFLIVGPDGGKLYMEGPNLRLPWDNAQLIDYFPFFATAREPRARGTIDSGDELGFFYSPELGNHRKILVYLPPGFHESHRQYRVLYGADGENLFHSGWNGWNLKNMLDYLISTGKMEPVIVVGVCNRGPSGPGDDTDYRMIEYGPRWKDWARFVAETLKPAIENRYPNRILKDPRHTGIFGSSMGGRVSGYAALAFPKTFGQAFSFSGTFSFERKGSNALEKEIVEQLLKDFPKDAEKPFLYFDSGDQGRAADNLQNNRELADLLEHGYHWRPGADFQYSRAYLGQHAEGFWGNRLMSLLPSRLPADPCRRALGPPGS